MINGSPYNPHSQGTVERLHNTIRNMLLTFYLENTENFDIEFSLKKVMNSYNNSVHKTTKYTPNEIYFIIITKKYLN